MQQGKLYLNCMDHWLNLVVGHMLSYAAHQITCSKTQELSPVVLSRAADSNLLNDEFNKEKESMKYI